MILRTAIIDKAYAEDAFNYGVELEMDTRLVQTIEHEKDDEK